MFHIRVVHFCDMLKMKVFTQNICLLSQKNFSLGLPNLGAQIICAQNWYTAVQMDLKYPLGFFDNIYFLSTYSKINMLFYFYFFCSEENCFCFTGAY